MTFKTDDGRFIFRISEFDFIETEHDGAPIRLKTFGVNRWVIDTFGMKPDTAFRFSDPRSFVFSHGFLCVLGKDGKIANFACIVSGAMECTSADGTAFTLTMEDGRMVALEKAHA